MLRLSVCHGGGLLLLLLLWLAACTPTRAPLTGIPAGDGRLELEIRGFRNDHGEALIYIYPEAKGFPEEDAPGLIRLHQAIHNRLAHVDLNHLPYHAYAIAVLHDENMNGQMDKSLLGFPQEGFGFSRNPAPHFGPPDYQKACFLFATPLQQQTIQIQYPVRGRKHPTRNFPAG